jgi:hypothetical protein
MLTFNSDDGQKLEISGSIEGLSHSAKAMLVLPVRQYGELGNFFDFYARSQEIHLKDGGIFYRSVTLMNKNIFFDDINERCFLPCRFHFSNHPYYKGLPHYFPIPH